MFSRAFWPLAMGCSWIHENNATSPSRCDGGQVDFIGGVSRVQPRSSLHAIQEAHRTGLDGHGGRASAQSMYVCAQLCERPVGEASVTDIASCIHATKSIQAVQASSLFIYFGYKLTLRCCTRSSMLETVAAPGLLTFQFFFGGGGGESWIDLESRVQGLTCPRLSITYIIFRVCDIALGLYILSFFLLLACLFRFPTTPGLSMQLPRPRLLRQRERCQDTH